MPIRLLNAALSQFKTISQQLHAPNHPLQTRTLIHSQIHWHSIVHRTYFKHRQWFKLWLYQSPIVSVLPISVKWCVNFSSCNNIHGIFLQVRKSCHKLEGRHSSQASRKRNSWKFAPTWFLQLHRCKTVWTGSKCLVKRRNKSCWIPLGRSVSYSERACSVKRSQTRKYKSTSKLQFRGPELMGPKLVQSLWRPFSSFRMIRTAA